MLRGLFQGTWLSPMRWLCRRSLSGSKGSWARETQRDGVGGPMCGGSGVVGSHCGGLAFRNGQSWPQALWTHASGRPAAEEQVWHGAAGKRAGKGAHRVLGEGIGFDPRDAFSHPFIQEARRIWGRSPRVDGWAGYPGRPQAGSLYVQVHTHLQRW